MAVRDSAAHVGRVSLPVSRGPMGAAPPAPFVRAQLCRMRRHLSRWNPVAGVVAARGYVERFRDAPGSSNP